MTVIRLPSYPSSRARKALPPSQLATLHQLISSTLLQCLNLPIAKCDTGSTVAFLSSYAQDAASRVLQDLIWASDGSDMSSVERTIRQRVLLLSEKVAAFLDFQTLLDLAVTYGKKNPKAMKNLFTVAFSQNNSLLPSQLSSEAVPVFTSLLGLTDSGLYGVRKVSHILLACLQPAPAEVRRAFARDKAFMMSLAMTYDQGLATVTQPYGGLRLSDHVDRELDDWERILLETKVALMDAFHLLIRVLFDDVAAVPNAGPALAAQCEPAFEVVFSLLEMPQGQLGSSGSSSSAQPTPFLNQSLLADYQHAYSLSRTVVSFLRKADDVRTQLLENALQSLDSTSTSSGAPGALKLIIRGSGIAPGIDHRGKGSQAAPTGKGKAVAASAPVKEDPALDAAVAQVLDILPDQPPHYVRYLLGHSDYPYQGSAERLIEALFEGTAPSVDDAEASMRAAEAEEHHHEQAIEPVRAEYQFTRDRRNVFDDDVMDSTMLRVGKKSDIATIQDRTFIEQMKADILRRAEEASYEDEDDEEATEGHGKSCDVAFEDELDVDGVKVRDGEASDDDEGSDAGGAEDKPAPPVLPETILEMAYINDRKVFERDARKSKGWADLKTQTGWSDEQIDGWRIMLERNPNKEKILQKHEFRGNKPLSHAELQAERSSHGQGRGRGRGGGGGRGRGDGRGRGGGGGGGGRGGGGGSNDARDRAYNDRKKAIRGNHNRKAGHDKKMARGGGPS